MTEPIRFKSLIALKSNANAKLDKTMDIKDFNVHILSWSLIPIKTCPCAKNCIGGCYAEISDKIYKTCELSDRIALGMSKQPDFIEIVNNDLKRLSFVKNLYVRLHVRGDFYDREYALKWVKIALDNPNVKFYAYTKSVSIIKSLGELPKNLIIAFSYGGTEDNLIDPKKDKHVIVVKDKESIPKGYVNCGDNDLTMFDYDKIAIVYHGQKSYDKTNWNKVILPI